MKDFRDLKVWQKAHYLALEVYKATQSFPKDELFALTNQTRRASVSIPANISEGCGRGSDAEFARFLQIARGSASELEYFIVLATELNYLNATESELLDSEVTEVKRMLSSLIKKLKADR